MTDAPIPVCCYACGNQACVNRVTAGLRCRCGSTEVDLVDGTPEQAEHLASLRTGQLSFLDFMRQASTSPVGTEIKGWNVYQGPPPAANPAHAPTATIPCPVCHGSGLDLQDGGVCRECGGDKRLTPTTSVQPAPLVARHPGTSTQTSVPFMGRRRQAAMPTAEEMIRATTPDYSSQGQRPPEHPEHAFAWDSPSTHYPRADTMSPATRYRQERDYSQPPKGHFEMPGAPCPNCGQDPTHLVKDHKEDAWWHCKNCGPLANIDKNPDIDPYQAPEGFLPNSKGFKASKTAKYSGGDRGSLLRIITTAGTHNPGLTSRELVFLARNTVSRYLEKS